MCSSHSSSYSATLPPECCLELMISEMQLKITSAIPSLNWSLHEVRLIALHGQCSFNDMLQCLGLLYSIQRHLYMYIKPT
jgi:hypothetical protein